MTKEQYKRARRMIRDNGRSAYAWIAKQMGGDWTEAIKLRDLADAKDWIAERSNIVAFCKREGKHCTPRQTSRNSYGTTALLHRLGAA